MNRRSFVTGVLRWGAAGALSGLFRVLPGVAHMRDGAPDPGRRSGSAEDPDTALVRRFCALAGASASPNAGGLLGPDAVWHATGKHAHDQDRRGPEAVLAAFTQFVTPGSHWKTVRTAPGFVLALQPAVSGHQPPSGVKILAFSVQAGRIAAIRPFEYQHVACQGLFDT